MGSCNNKEAPKDNKSGKARVNPINIYLHVCSS